MRGQSPVSKARRAAATAARVPRERSFDAGWLFLRGDPDGAQQPSYDDTAWRTLDLPHDWSIEDLPYAGSTDGAATSDPSLLVLKDPDPARPPAPQEIGPFDTARSQNGGSTGYTVGGLGWYRRHFELDAEHAELRFDGVYQNADVWLNGVHLGFHPYGYTSFAYDLGPHLDRTGPNLLAVRVDNSGRNSRWYSGSGIYRHTWLAVTGPVRIPLWGVHVTTPEVGAQRSTVHVGVTVEGAPADVRVTVLDPHGDPVATRRTAARRRWLRRARPPRSATRVSCRAGPWPVPCTTPGAGSAIRTPTSRATAATWTSSGSASRRTTGGPRSPAAARWRSWWNARRCPAPSRSPSGGATSTNSPAGPGTWIPATR
ncbi:sugar-binding domain-containing protein [Streptomyces sp. NPDC005921]